MGCLPNKEQVASLLDRPLSQKEDTNFKTYLNSAKTQLELILNTSICGSGERFYEPREGFISLVVDVFSDKEITVRVNDEELANADYKVSLNGDRNGDWYNMIEFKRPMSCNQEISVEAEWGYGDCLPSGVLILLVALFEAVSGGQATSGANSKVKSETILTHSTTFDTSSEAYQSVMRSNQTTIDIYANPDECYIDSSVPARYYT